MEVRTVFFSVFRKLLILRKRRHQGKEQRAAVAAACGQGIDLADLGVFVVLDGHDTARGWVVYGQVIGIRRHCGLILGHILSVRYSNRALAAAIPATAKGVHGLYH